MNHHKLRHANFNAESRNHWQAFADHRRRVSTLLIDCSKAQSGRLCVVGVGNANDLDIPALLEAYREVHLVDIDDAALSRGVDKQGLSNHPRLKKHGCLDVTSMLDAIAGWSPRSPIASQELTALVEWPSVRVGLSLPGPFDVVASTCLLSQIVGNAFHSVGEYHPQFFDAVRAIRLGHLRLLVHLARPGGMVLMITDMVSSERYPKLESIPEHSLSDLLNFLALNRGLIHGVNPAEILANFRQDPVLSSRVARLEPIPPWRWKLHERQYLVWALKCSLGRKAQGS